MACFFFGILGPENLAFEADPWKLVVFRGNFEKFFGNLPKKFLRKLFEKVCCPLNLHID
jgi:hypothetical protein